MSPSPPLVPPVNCFAVRAHSRFGASFKLALLFDTREAADLYVESFVGMQESRRPLWLAIRRGGRVLTEAVYAYEVVGDYDPAREEKGPRSRAKRRQKVAA